MNRAPAKTISEWVSHAMEDSACEERAAVVAYLRDEANTPHPTETDEFMLPFNMRFLLLASAIQIELGEHRKDDKP